MRPVKVPAWLLPDLALVVACVTLVYCLFLFQGYRKLFRDSDAGWHIRTGEAILATGELPRTDPYSFTRGGQPWFAWEWMADIAAGAVDRAAGLSGVALFYAAAIAAGVWLWFRLHWALDGNFLLACAMAPLLLSTCNIHWLARPHILSWLFLLAALLHAERARPPFRLRHAVEIAIFTALWANIHASFFFAPLIALLYIWRGPVRWFLWAALISAIAPLANPYGWHLYAHVFRYLTDSELLSRIGEFQSFDFHAPGSWPIIATLLVAVAGGTLALLGSAKTWGLTDVSQGARSLSPNDVPSHRRVDASVSPRVFAPLRNTSASLYEKCGPGSRPEHFVLAMLLAAMALRSARALPLVALLVLPLANAAITATLRRAAVLDGFLTYSARLRAIDARFSGLALVPLVLLACFALLRTPAIQAATGFPPDQFPVEAYSQIARLPAGARLFAPDKFGGYLIYRSQGARKVFFDGRSDLYGADFLKQYARMVQLRPGWREYWDSFHFTHALVPNDYSLIPALEQLGWTLVYHDQTVTLLKWGML